MSTLRLLLALALLASGSLTLSACNTLGGAGEDLSEGGDAMSDAADDAED
ncbi:MAG TPA: entericidin A/B family lipoprotein [Geminicoccus sp.]|jgi:predicted small secreted protein|nr:entericidin A/B family lipoprotein [Geminicoccus sp.]HEX2525004.1 entericidin A/B family lipoprotein [Geminicoccus sp.]